MNIIGSITEELQEVFVKELNEITSCNPTSIDIYLDSSGGNSFVSDAMADMITEVNKQIPVTLIATGNVMSAAFTLLFNSVCQKKVLDNCIGMYHKGKIDCELYDGNIFDREDTKKRKYALARELVNEEFIERIGLTEKEIKQYKKNKDVFFMPERMKELIEKDVNRVSFGEPFMEVKYYDHEGNLVTSKVPYESSNNNSSTSRPV